MKVSINSYVQNTITLAQAKSRVKREPVPFVSSYSNGRFICLLNIALENIILEKYSEIINKSFFVETPNFNYKDQIITLNKDNIKYVKIYDELGLEYIEENSLSKSL